MKSQLKLHESQLDVSNGLVVHCAVYDLKIFSAASQLTEAVLLRALLRHMCALNSADVCRWLRIRIFSWKWARFQSQLYYGSATACQHRARARICQRGAPQLKAFSVVLSNENNAWRHRRARVAFQKKAETQRRRANNNHSQLLSDSNTHIGIT